MDMRRQFLLDLGMEADAVAHVDQIGFFRTDALDIGECFFQGFMRRVSAFPKSGQPIR